MIFFLAAGVHRYVVRGQHDPIRFEPAQIQRERGHHHRFIIDQEDTHGSAALLGFHRHLAGHDALREVTIAKLRTQRAAFHAIDACLDIHGLDAPPELERAARDARLGPIGGGTDEIMKEILGRSLGL